MSGKLLGMVHFVDRGGKSISAMGNRHTSQLPQRILKSRAQTFETLRETHSAIFPVGVRQDKMIEQMIEGLPINGDPRARSYK